MPLVVEDGSGVDGANTSVSRAETISYAADRGVTLPDTTATDGMILTANVYLMGLPWRGTPVNKFQFTPFPRDNCYPGEVKVIPGLPYFDGLGYQLVPGFNPPAFTQGEVYPNDEVPADIKNAQMELVIQQKAGLVILPVTGDQPFVIQDTVGPLTTKYSDKYGPVIGSPTMPTVDVYLLKWLDDDGGPFTLRTRRV